MRKLIISFSFGAMVGMAIISCYKTICECKDDVMSTIKDKIQKICDQMQSSIRGLKDNQNEEDLDEILSELETIYQESLPNKAKKAVNKIKNLVFMLKKS